MEQDRHQTHLGETSDAELGPEKEGKQKQPKKRFIGRKEAAERAQKRGDANEAIETSKAIQGARRVSKVCQRDAEVLQLHNQERRPEHSIKFLQISSTIPK